jgi:hypothetical protein
LYLFREDWKHELNHKDTNNCHTFFFLEVPKLKSFSEAVYCM